jgi:hypothetical protein
MAELVQSNVNALVTQGTEPALKAAIGATRTVPIVMIATNFDPFVGGYVKSLSRPGGNVTGLFLRQTELAEKQTELLLEAVPDKKRLGILWDLISTAQFSAAERRAKAFGLDVDSLNLKIRPTILTPRFRPWWRLRHKCSSSCPAHISRLRVPELRSSRFRTNYPQCSFLKRTSRQADFCRTAQIISQCIGRLRPKS